MSSDFSVKQKFHSFVGVSVDIGDRRAMEDEFMVNIQKYGLSYFGVYDGHAGSLASGFAKENLSKKFYENSPNNLKNKTKLQSAMTAAHVAVDKEYLVHEQEARKDGYSTFSGTTSASLVMKQSEGWGFVSNAGDCRTVLFHQGKCVSLSTDHRVNRSGVSNSEMERVISLGGWMEDGLMCGQLEPTRGLGDHDFKTLKSSKFPEKTFKGDLVTPIPEFEWFSLTSNAEEIISSTSCTNDISVGLTADHYSFIVIASDGIWDVIPNYEVLQAVSERLNTNCQLNGEIVQRAADELMRITRQQTRKQKMQMDNTTVILIAFAPCEDAGHFHSADSSCLFCFEPNVTPHTESIINSKASSLASSRKNKQRRNKKRKKRQQAKKQKK